MHDQGIADKKQHTK